MNQPAELTMQQLAALADTPLYSGEAVEAISFKRDDGARTRTIFIWPPEPSRACYRASTYDNEHNDFRNLPDLPAALTFAAQFMA